MTLKVGIRCVSQPEPQLSMTCTNIHKTGAPVLEAQIQIPLRKEIIPHTLYLFSKVGLKIMSFGEQPRLGCTGFKLVFLSVVGVKLVEPLHNVQIVPILRSK